MKEVDGSIEVSIDALILIFELQKLKTNFVFLVTHIGNDAPANGKSVDTVGHNIFLQTRAVNGYGASSTHFCVATKI